MKTVYVTIDLQNDYFPGGRFPLFRAGRALKQALSVLKQARREGASILHIRHQGQDPAARFLREGTPGAELHPQLCVDALDQVIDKHFPDAFLGTPLQERLEHLAPDRVVWMGMMSWMCVDTTVRSAKAKGFQNIVISDATASSALMLGLPIFPWTVQRSFLAALSYHHAQVLTAADFLKAAGKVD